MVDRIYINYLATKLRKNLGLNNQTYFSINDYIKSDNSLSFVRYPFSERISGMCIKEKRISVISINSKMNIGRQRFSFAHELYHLLYDNKQQTISDINFEINNEVENEANYFASCLLIPYETLMNEIDNTQITKRRILEIENKYGISHSALLYRLKIDGILNEQEIEKLKEIKVMTLAKQYGLDTKLYQDVTNYSQKKTEGNYINQVNILKNSEMISEGKYKELLITAFREDLAYKI